MVNIKKGNMKFIFVSSLILILFWCSNDRTLEDKVSSHCYDLEQDYVRLLDNIESTREKNLEVTTILNSFNAAVSLSFCTFIFCSDCRERDKLKNYDELSTEFSVRSEDVYMKLRSDSLTDDEYEKLIEDVKRLMEIIETVNSLPMAN